ncbi:MAG TPA: DJ-1 family glyoxalase III [Candidatus Saccharimonadales bacterium]|nr:DJ-1 family glyoxalase III [Candidatus Saccharimonadales bacterium]
MKKRVLCVLFPGFEEIETIAPVDLLRRAGVEVLVASLTGELLVMGRCNVTVKADVTFDEVEHQEFDLLLLPGGPGIKAVRVDGRPARLARAYADAGKLVAAICAAPTVLADAGLLTGRRFTSHAGVMNELPESLVHERVVEDQNIITSRGAATSVDFGLALVRRLCGDSVALEVSKGIMA